MPEQLTKHPDATLEVLRSAGAKCGEGAPQVILTQCPAERFCKLPGGEICVFAPSETPRMTQFTPDDWQALSALNLPGFTTALGSDALLAGAIGLMAGAVLSRYVSWRRDRGR